MAERPVSKQWQMRVQLNNAILSAIKENSRDLSIALVCSELREICHDLEAQAGNLRVRMIVDDVPRKNCSTDAATPEGQSAGSD